ncbi:MAG: DUF899 domain-containing protein, partial [Salinisphaera sp.]|nr:DUF899 domain-containing protein [Salinisphaera sp.]
MDKREAWLRRQGASHEGERVEPPARCAERRKLPMVRIEKDYVFEGPREIPGLRVFLCRGTCARPIETLKGEDQQGARMSAIKDPSSSLYTDDRAQLEALISARSGVRQTALESIHEREAEQARERAAARTADAERQALAARPGGGDASVSARADSVNEYTFIRL